jgi:hypothetical protein
MNSTSRLALQTGLAESRSATDTTAASPRLADDLIESAEEIAEFFFGDRSQKSRRRVFYLAAKIDPAHRPPIFRLGAKLAARRSRLLQWIAEREEAASRPPEGGCERRPAYRHAAERWRERGGSKRWWRSA